MMLKRLADAFSKCLRNINHFIANVKFYLITHILNVAFRLLRTAYKHFKFSKGFK